MSGYEAMIACLVGIFIMLFVGAVAAYVYGKQRKYEEAAEQARVEMEILLGNKPEEQASQSRDAIRVPWLTPKLELADLGIGAVGFIGGVIALTVVASFLAHFVFRQPLITIFVTVAAIGVPFLLLSRKAKQVTDRFGEQLVTALPMMTSLLKSGMTINQAIAAVGENLVEPAKTEFARIARELMVGAQLHEAVYRSAVRTQNADMEYFARALAVQKEQGGELSLVLESITESIRARIKLRAQLRAAVAMPKMEMYIVTALPWLLFVYFSLAVPSYVAIFWNEPVGWAAILVVILLDLVGYLIMRRLVNMDID